MSEYGWFTDGNGRSVYRRIDRTPRGPRSDLSAPMVVTDTMDALWHPSTGEMIESKSRFRSVTKEHGGTEVGNEVQTDNRHWDVATSSDVGEAVRKVKSGYKPATAETAKDGWSERAMADRSLMGMPTFIEAMQGQYDPNGRRSVMTLPPTNGPQMSARDDTFREKLTSLMAASLESMGFPGGERGAYQYSKNNVMPLAELTPVGAVTAGDDFLRAETDEERQGAVLGMFGGPGAKTANRSLMSVIPKPGIKAYHGSPHSFDKFSLDKIGTGEGAQAYGHGLYFAENEGIAKGYRDTLTNRTADSSTPQGAVERALGLADNSPDKARKSLEANRRSVQRTLDRKLGGQMDAFAQQQADMYDEAIRLLDSGYKPGGSMYEVNINADPDAFLDWDKPLSEQSEATRNAVHDLFKSGALDGKDKRASSFYSYPGSPEHIDTMSGERIREMLAAYRTAGQSYGYQDLPMIKAGTKGNADATRLLTERGVPGIKYLDAGSRTAGDGSRNYVVFDDKLIEIVKKYGIAGALGAGLISQQMAEQMQAQGIGRPES